MPGKILKIFADISEKVQTLVDRLAISHYPPIVLYHPPPSGVLLFLPGEAIDLLGSSPKSILLKSKGESSMSFRRVGAFLVIQSEGLERVLE